MSDQNRQPANTEPAALSSVLTELRKCAGNLGINRIGVTDASPASRFDLYRRWIAEGYHGEMSYLAREDRVRRRADLTQILPGAERVVCCALPYWPATSTETSQALSGAISRYSRGTDYHSVFGAKLEQLSGVLERHGGMQKVYVDTGPLMERDLAERAGLGFVGKNTLLIDPRYGSGLFLGEILTTLPLPIAPAVKMPDCGSCTRCLTACPTDAFSAPYQLDAQRCISYLTIELKGSIPKALRPLVGSWIYGCDVCQTVCPWNRFADTVSLHPWSGPSPVDDGVELIPLLEISDAEFQRRFEGTPIARLKRPRFVRNVAVALGNSGDRRALPALYRALRDPEALVREHAAWAISQLTHAD